MDMRAIWTILLALSTMSLASCNQYLERKNSIALSAGDAVAANAAIQTPDPWPREAYNTNIRSDGRVAETAYQRYSNDRIKRFEVEGTSEGEVHVQPVFDPGLGISGAAAAGANASQSAAGSSSGQ